MKRLVLKKAVFTLALTIGFAATSFAAHLSGQLTFSARMDGAQEVPGVTTNAKGVATMVLNSTRDSLCITANMGGFGSTLNGLHLHSGAAGTNGAVVVNLSDYITDNSIQVVLTGALLPATLVEEMINGTIYFNAHTINNPNGEIRGQVKLETDFAYRAFLNGLQEVPATLSTATGVGVFNVSLDNKKMNFFVTTSGLSGAITGAHFHTAAAGMNGGVAVDLTPNISGNNLSGVIDISGVSGFAAALASGGVYLNLHTADEPNGEIRGQVLLENNVAFDAKLDTAQQTGPVTGANGNGAAYFAINRDFTAIDYSVQVEGLSGAITAAHLHEGTAGNNGGVLVDLSGDIDGNRISGTITGAALTQNLITELLESGVYINVHTAMNPNGEIRGQINRVAREGYTVTMNGGQEVPAVSTMASGGGIVTISRDRNNAHVMLVAQNMAGNISGAHLHNAAAGSNGGVLFDLTGLFTGNASFSSAFGYLTSDDATPFNAAAEVEARNNRLYVNIHNMTNPNGEIRGQVYRGSECNTISALGLEEANKVSTLSVYPNPAGSSLTISKENFVAGETMNMISISGQVVKTIVMTQNGQTVNIADLKTGVYFLQGANTAALKVVKL